MVNRQLTNSLDATFAALSDPTRRAILRRLAQGDVAVSELAAPFDMSLPAVSKHLQVLERAGLITRRKIGRVRWCHLRVNGLKDAADWLNFYQGFWSQQLDVLEDFLNTGFDDDSELSDKPGDDV